MTHLASSLAMLTATCVLALFLYLVPWRGRDGRRHNAHARAVGLAAAAALVAYACWPGNFLAGPPDDAVAALWSVTAMLLAAWNHAELKRLPS